MLTTVIIILREFLEAALLISLLAALHLRLFARNVWIFAASLLGVAGAFLYASVLADISMWFDGSGQEVINGISLIGISLCLAYQLVGINRFYRDLKTTCLMTLTITAVLIVTLAITREGAEIFVYFSSINAQKASSMATGGIIGSGLGICIGILLFVVLYQLPLKHLVISASTLLVLLSAGILSEATRSFIQAGLLLSGEPLWNTSWLIPEASVIGQLLYAIFAYEATPTREEVLIWIMTVLSLCSALIWIHADRMTVKK